MTPPPFSIKIALGADFLMSFARLPQKQQKQVREFLDKFTENPTGSALNYEPVQGARDPNLRSVRMGSDYRGIILKPRQGNVYVLLWVDHHDEAYRWARNRTCIIHPVTGTMQVILTETVEPEEPGTIFKAPPAMSGSISIPSPDPAPEVPESAQPEPGLFDAVDDATLISLGVPETRLSDVRQICHESDIENAESSLPREAFEAIFLLAAGYTPDEVRHELDISRETVVDTDDFSAAIERAGSRRQFVVVTDAIEMEKILAAPLDQWRIFLHPSQRRLVEMTANGPVRVLGSAGTGKTVVAMHRAAWLARQLDMPGQKILFTTFTRNLAADIAENLKKLCSPDEWNRIEVVNLDAWVRRFLEKQGFYLKMTYEDASSGKLWDRALSMLPANLSFSPDFLRAEWVNVVQAHGIVNLQGYIRVPRVGRSQRLSRPERQAIWPVFEEYRALLLEKGLSEPADAYRDAARLIQDQRIGFPYAAVIVDEAQDFGNEAFRLIRELVRPGTNDLFIVGDAHQRLYGHQVTLSRCGIDIRGRGRKLRINYRTTEEIKNWATGLLRGLDVDDLDVDMDDLAGVRSLTHGSQPVIQSCFSEKDAARIISDHIRQLMKYENAEPEAICLVTRSNRELDVYGQYLSPICPSVHRIETSRADDGSKPGLRLATIHRVKGLEFDHVIVAGHTDELEPVDETPGNGLENRILMYVAATRARKSLLVCRIRSNAGFLS
ncbi:UvrD-helicase domain-containing protein [Desulfatirhabdium butyrativorans]|uniref:UvrD-helicase domain-containing protein n=1 Tax=Desulfatirhabdium butyrativorans TaxID=340467 RepID=UPI00041ED739|nr:UvrD-helicase domain-containing protein [Desulfatirhabdium butyrativorans]